MTDIIEVNNVGVIIRDRSDEALRSAMRKIMELTGDHALQARCRRIAREKFSLDRGVAAYAGVYDRLAAG
jgi:hypothetical protein